MKKLLTTVLAVAVCVIMAFSLTGCTEKEFKGNYKDCTKEDLEQLMIDINAANLDDFSSVQGGFSIKGKVSYQDIDVLNTVSIDMSAIDGDSPKFAGSVIDETSLLSNVEPGSAEKSALGIGKDEVAFYFSNGKEYTHSNLDGKIENKTSDAVYDTSLTTLLASFDFSPVYYGLIMEAIADESGELLKSIDIAKSNSSTKLKLTLEKDKVSTTLPDETVVDVTVSGEIYLSFADDFSLRGIKMNYNMTTANTRTYGSQNKKFTRVQATDVDFVLVPFDGNISVPKALQDYAKA